MAAGAAVGVNPLAFSWIMDCLLKDTDVMELAVTLEKELADNA